MASTTRTATGRPDPAVAAVRSAVRRVLAGVDPAAGPVLVACSGGPDSFALVDAVAFEAPRAGVRAGAVTIDHGLQAGSGARADELARFLRTRLGLDPVEVRAVEVAPRGGPEAAARDARYRALAELAATHGSPLVLLGHTRDDQAETVLLGLARGSGARSLAGMAASFTRATSAGESVRFARPLLALTRATTEAACTAAGLRPWADPHNADAAYARSRVRHRVMPVLERELGPGVAAALARTADQLRDDADALDALVPGAADRAARVDGTLVVSELLALPRAIRTRVLRRWLLAAGAPPADLTRAHVVDVEDLVLAWHGQGPLSLPGGLRVARRAVAGPAGSAVLEAHAADGRAG